MHFKKQTFLFLIRSKTDTLTVSFIQL